MQRADGTIFLCVPVEGENLVVTVRDTGIGIDKAMLDRIFDLFTRDTHGVAQQSGGLGIGLSVFRAIAEMHGGPISAASDGEGCGSVFSLQSPIVTSNIGFLAQVEPIFDEPSERSSSLTTICMPPRP